VVASDKEAKHPLDLDAQTPDGDQPPTASGAPIKGRFLVIITTLSHSRNRVDTPFPEA
jgi:hypothetical protein